MKKITLFISCLLLVSILAACGKTGNGATEPSTTEPSTTQPSVTQTETAKPEPAPTVPEEHMFEELGFGLRLPPGWYERYELAQEGDVISLEVDGTPFAAYTALENSPGIWEKEAALLEDGYEYLCQTESHVYYYKVFGEAPTDLSQHFTGHGGGGYVSEAAYDARSLFFIQTDTCSFDGGTLFDVRLNPVDSQYTDHRLGLSLNLPEAWLEHCVLVCNDYSLSIYTAQNETPALSFYVPNAHSTGCGGTTEHSYLGASNGRTYYACVYEYDSVSGRDYNQLAENAEALRAMLPELYSILEPVEISDENGETDAISSTVLSFLEDFNRVTYLYEDVDLSGYTTASLDEAARGAISLPVNSFPNHLLLTKQFAAVHPQLDDQSEYILAKADHLRTSRLEEELFREEFLPEYHLHCIHVSGDYAQVWISDSKSFYYEGNSEASYMSDSYEIYLVKANGQWLVFDMFSTDSFDSQYKLEDLSAEDLLP